MIKGETSILSSVGGLVTELDPDAPGRQGKTLHPENVKSEERLQARMWQLIRAGG
jgi:hypothetical protein